MQAWAKAAINKEDDDLYEIEGDDKMEAESYVGWMIKATSIAENCARKAKVSDWVVSQRQKKLKLAGHIARRNYRNWSTLALAWTPNLGARKVERPSKRWSDSLDHYRAQWVSVAAHRASWRNLKQGIFEESR